MIEFPGYNLSATGDACSCVFQYISGMDYGFTFYIAVVPVNPRIYLATVFFKNKR